MMASSDDTYTSSASKPKYCATYDWVVSTSRSMSVPSFAKPMICEMPFAPPRRVSTVVKGTYACAPPDMNDVESSTPTTV